ncbi:hypothetical protein KEJ51_08470, partial [Candidatus Bathyarchaeota archaeon]|nr:hypothetical protein [Candidatus Bathyarchaeota archaeon]
MDAPTLFQRNIFLIRQKILAIGSSYDIMDERGETIGIAKSEILTLGPKIAVKDLLGNTLIRIEGNVLRTKFTVSDQFGNRIAVTKMPKFSLKPKLDLESSTGELLLRSEGKLFAHDFELKDGTGNTVAKMHKKWRSFTDS